MKIALRLPNMGSHFVAICGVITKYDSHLLALSLAFFDILDVSVKFIVVRVSERMS